jgi:hypothetical protein
MEAGAAAAFGVSAAKAGESADQQSSREKILHVVSLPEKPLRGIFLRRLKIDGPSICHRFERATSQVGPCEREKGGHFAKKASIS